MNDEAVNAISELTREGMRMEVQTFEGNDVPYYRTPEGHAETCEQLLDRPVRKRGHPLFHARESFSRYVKEHKRTGTRIFANVAEGPSSMLAVLDYHDPLPDGAAHWAEHKASFNMAYSEAFKIWRAQDNKIFEQKAFALFLEENLVDIRTPDGASVLECAIHLQGKTSANFEKAIRLENGNQSLQYIETTVARGGVRGDLEVPKQLELMIPVFRGELPVSILAKLRHRIEGGAVTFRYELHRIQEVMESALTYMLETVEKETEIEPFRGTLF